MQFMFFFHAFADDLSNEERRRIGFDHVCFDRPCERSIDLRYASAFTPVIVEVGKRIAAKVDT